MVEKINGMDPLIKYLTNIITNRFGNSLSRAYYGDVGTYLPSAFLGPRGEQRAILVLQPLYNRLNKGERVASHENRTLGLDVACLVNITPFFNADPKAAYGEEMLTKLITEIGTWLTQEENVRLGGRVEHTEIGDYNWAWLPKGDQAIRGAAITYEARVRIPRL